MGQKGETLSAAKRRALLGALWLALPAFAQGPSSTWGDLTVVIDATQSGPHKVANPGDGIFIPRTAQIARADKTGRPFTGLGPMQEPAFSQIAVPNKATGDRFVIKFPQGEHGGSCLFDGTARYFVDAGGELLYQLHARCGDLERGYEFMVCALDEGLRCSEAPWWNFRGRTYTVTAQGVIVNATLYAWDDSAQAAGKLQTIASRLQANRERRAQAANVLHRRVISCRAYHPQEKRYSVSEIVTGCLVGSCSGGPDLGSLRDGEVIRFTSSLGEYIQQKDRIASPSDWDCWLRTQ